MSLASLPIDDVLPEIVQAMRSGHSVVLRAPTGAGKTTRVPPAILEAQATPAGQILVLQPRRIAARATAARMSLERGTALGEEIGYQTRFDSRVSARTRIVCMTEGILLRRLLEDPFLDGVACVVFDEFHERNLASDLSLGMIRQVQQAVRPDLQIVVMSATLDPQPIAQYLANAVCVESLGRTFPVTIEHTNEIERRRVEDAAVWGVRELLPRTPGHLLVFLPGVGEIRRTAELLEPLATEHDFALLELYGDLSPEQQDRVLAPSPRRKVILATNVAETSLTIDGVTGVIDSGLARVLMYEEQLGLDRLELVPISQAAAEQRAGRAGRTQPGVCLRLWPAAAHRARPERETPEVRRVDLSGALLQLACWIEPDPQLFPWFEAPRPLALETSLRLLRRLGALNAEGITPLGRAMAALPLPPRLSRLLIEAARLGAVERGAVAAALLSERDPFLRSAGARQRRPAQHVSDSDLLDRVLALEQFAERGYLESECGTLQKHAAKTILKTQEQLLRAARAVHGDRGESQLSSDAALLRAVLAGYPDRLAKRRELAGRRGVMVGGRGVRLAEQSSVSDAELFVCLELGTTRTEGNINEALVTQASAVRREWLSPELLSAGVEVFFDEAKQQLTARRRLWWEDLLLEESPAALPKGEAVAQALATAAVDHWQRAFPHDNDAVMGFVNRVRFLNQHLPELGWPLFDQAYLQALLPDLCRGCSSFEQLRQAPWLDHLRGALSYAQLQTLDREAPERITLPSGNRVAIQYEPDQNGQIQRPVLAARIQELFGWQETPRIANGRVALLLHLLAPNMRPQQITDDLRSFWNNTYQQVRKDLRGRYPKHPWPEDPWTAEAKRRKT
jgi:ATP-dependent helicase HrpB